MNKSVMVSYSQNYEDVILQRALRNVSRGFYIDVGAAHPVHDSVTCHFYKSGWSGINIDPLGLSLLSLLSFLYRAPKNYRSEHSTSGHGKWYDDGW